MKKIFSSVALFFLCTLYNFAQQNCSNPIQVNVCPGVYLSNQTNAGMLNDNTSFCNLAGEDLVYQINASLSTQRIYVSIVNASGPLRLYLVTGACATGSCTSKTVAAGNSNWTFNVSGYAVYYLWVDASTTITYDIAFGRDTANAVINIPNTQGNLQFDASGCATPMFKASKPYFQVKYNGVYQTDPMMMSPLFVTGSLCIIVYFQNTTGIEGIRKFDFYYNPLGFSSFAAAPAVVPGFYNAGNWVSSNAGAKWTFTFNDALGIGQGDFTVLPNTCLRYEFCFDVIPISNDPVLTNIKDSARSDGFGAPFSGTVHYGCCPSPFLNCLGASGSSAGTSGHAFGFGFADPGGLLPIVLLQFDAIAENGKVEVSWITQSETNNDYFTIEKSGDGTWWTSTAIIDGAGNSTEPQLYHYSDADPPNGISYYRLKQTDYDGTVSFSQAVAVKINYTKKIIAFPNPTKGDLTITGIASDTITLFNILGMKMQVTMLALQDKILTDLSTLPNGVYLLEVNQDGIYSHQKIILQHED